MSNTVDEASADENPFQQLGLDLRIVAALGQLGFSEPTPIQAAAIPPLLEGHDLLGRARTGSGKTAAFGLPVLHKLSQTGEGLRALILAPTRELAVQITTALRSYGTGLGLKLVTLYGGSAYGPQFKALQRGVDIVVGTPGRLLDHLERGSLDLSAIELVVVDEADEMLRMGFVDDVDKLLGATPEGRQVALFSATMPEPIRRVAETYLAQPLEVQVEARRMVVEHIDQHRIDVPRQHKIDALVRVLKAKQPGATLIFARMRDTCDELVEALRERGFYAQALHGNMSQPAREEVLGALRTGRLELLVATDVAARGIDVEHLTHVINFDLPEEAAVYVNRIGRTGRAGRAGTAISLVSDRDLRLLRGIEAIVKRKIPRRPVPTDAEIVARQREELERALLEVKRGQNEGAKAVSQRLLEADWTPEELAEAALGLLIQDRHLDIEAEPSETPPAWSVRRETRQRTKPSRARDGAARSRPDEDMLVLHAAVGREHGIGASDVVGALANELGVSSRLIGRIAIFDRHLTVGVSPEALARLEQSKRTIFLRGTAVSFTRDGEQVGQKPRGRAKASQADDGSPRRRKPVGGKRGGYAPAKKMRVKAKASKAKASKAKRTGAPKNKS